MNSIDLVDKLLKDKLILIVDDNIVNVQVLRSSLRAENYRTAVANNGIEALEFVDKLIPDLILLDIMMPEIDGFEVCRKIKANPKTMHIPIIFLTAKNESDDVVKGFKLGGLDYITKPFNHDELLIRIKTHLELVESKNIILQQNQKLKKLNIEKNKILSIVSHDLKNPINTIVGFAKICENPESLSYDELKEFSRYIRISGDSMYQIVSNLLDINMIEEGRISVNCANFKVNSMIREKINLDMNKAKEKKIRINFESGSEDLVINSDINKIGQIVSNLISNSIKFSPHSSTIHISSSIIYNLKNNTQYLSISIKDEGPGIKEEEIDLLFKKFAKLSARPTGDESSTGLGLSIVKQISDLLGGSVRCESIYNEGANFIFELPLS